ncbi:MAG TPA: Hsp20/alpha crystallin family protein [Spirochaetota bacterium]|nr:Hsp20/alpha crystallin family protein [Spirochaetota bacterium]HRZ26232.1 Hsp20/alpha crystallin family protein [Spirochaetota bacterium]HSA13972.1 Hsp20/alpha crystallin family protein [Spirochaetota bacterium]
MATKRMKDNYCEECMIVPVADIYETDDAYSLKLEMPGVKKENLEITMNDNELEISGKIQKDETNGKNLKYSEYELFDYYRSFRVGNDIDRNSIKAELDNGILTLTLHKSEEVKPRKIQITAS